MSWPCLVSCSSSEIPQYRLPYDVVSFEVDLMKDLGVKVRDSHMTTVCDCIVLFLIRVCCMTII